MSGAAPRALKSRLPGFEALAGFSRRESDRLKPPVQRPAHRHFRDTSHREISSGRTDRPGSTGRRADGAAGFDAGPVWARAGAVARLVGVGRGRGRSRVDPGGCGGRLCAEVGLAGTVRGGRVGRAARPGAVGLLAPGAGRSAGGCAGGWRRRAGRLGVEPTARDAASRPGGAGFCDHRRGGRRVVFLARPAGGLDGRCGGTRERGAARPARRRWRGLRGRSRAGSARRHGRRLCCETTSGPGSDTCGVLSRTRS